LSDFIALGLKPMILPSEPGAPRVFPNKLIYTDDNTIETCLKKCSDYGFPAGGTEYGEECYCGDVEDIAAAIIFLSSPLGKFVTGEEWYIDGGETLHLAHDARQMIDMVKFSRREPAVPKIK